MQFCHRHSSCVGVAGRQCLALPCVCRATGGQGVVGSSAASGELHMESDQGHIEVACTAHTTAGVRRLVKSVIRGLKVRDHWNVQESSSALGCAGL